MSDTEFERIKAKCHNRLNWSDGGYWIGTGSEPDCFQKDEKRQESEVTYIFQDAVAARNFNLAQDKLKTQRDWGIYGIGGVFAVAAQVLSLGWAGVLGGLGIGAFGTSISKFPPVQAGDRIRVTFIAERNISPHPWADNKGHVRYTITHFQGNKPVQIVNISQTVSSRDYNGDELIESIFKYISDNKSKITYTFTGNLVKVTR